MVFSVNEEDNAGNFWEVILPKTTSFSLISISFDIQNMRLRVCMYLVDVRRDRRW